MILYELVVASDAYCIRGSNLIFRVFPKTFRCYWFHMLAESVYESALFEYTLMLFFMISDTKVCQRI